MGIEVNSKQSYLCSRFFCPRPINIPMREIKANGAQNFANSRAQQKQHTHNHNARFTFVCVCVCVLGYVFYCCFFICEHAYAFPLHVWLLRCFAMMRALALSCDSQHMHTSHTQQRTTHNTHNYLFFSVHNLRFSFVLRWCLCNSIENKSMSCLVLCNLLQRANRANPNGRTNERKSERERVKSRCRCRVKHTFWEARKEGKPKC